MFKLEAKSAKDMDLKELEEFLSNNPSNPELAFSFSKTQDPAPFQEIEKLKEQVKFLQDQCNFARSETKRTQDQYEIDKVNWSLEVQHLKKLLQRNSSDDSLKNDLKKQKILTKDLQAKVEQLTSDLLLARKDLDQVKSTSNKKIQQLEIQVERLKKREIELNRKLDDKNKGVEKLKMQKEKSSLKNSRSGSGFAEKTKKLSLDNGLGEEDIRKEIGIMEKEIGELGVRYKELLAKSETGDVGMVREQLTEITELMDFKNQQLVELKKKQQQAIRESLRKLESKW